MLPFVFLAIAATGAAAHGYVPFIEINGTVIPGWDIAKDPYTTPQPLRVVRGTKLDSGFISDVTSTDITCSIGNSALPPGPITANVAAGGSVKMLWNTWPIGHYGPVLNYMAKCATDDCSTFKGDTGSPWFKIQQSVYENGEWASDTLAKNNFTYEVRIPSNIASGSYLLRHENLALHGASNVGGAQFYPVCVQLTVTGGGSLAPSGGLSFPGSYDAEDPGIHFNPYQGEAANQAYVPPGGDVYPGLT
ncbi:lytic polysaccharide monooxygenase [Cylindrobasidium torrendii FP15055 ss-10]|uniref:lytic cellulose monooxygenase (C4-dehydrogenating) n=1 Tax=Cylindrobasidium torrendii FP15055 ss-10 TaxID=1314674 RepID=A0A0D7B5V2_9AGAR|nr:lytic polysaccharide monooxygenase [Cylindrobasidium torrendii FP15055 ss-10]